MRRYGSPANAGDVHRLAVTLPSRPGHATTRRRVGLPISQRSYGLRLGGVRSSVGTSLTSIRDASLPVVWPTAKGTITITHPGASDGAGGTGARAVTLWVWMADGSLAEYEVELGAGSSTVDTTANAGETMWVLDAYVSQAGSAGGNVADLQIDVGVVTTGVATILAGKSRTRGAQLWVPSTCYAVIRGLVRTAAPNNAAFEVRARDASTPASPGPWVNLPIVAPSVDRLAEDLDIVLAPSTQLDVLAAAVASTSEVAAVVDVTLVPAAAVGNLQI